jgi:large subunit ribosomal protein L15
MPFYRRIPKRGFVNPTREEYVVVNVGDLGRLADDVVDPRILRERGLAKGGLRVKVLGSGELGRAVTVSAHAFSKSARTKIEQAGGRVEVLS